MTRRRMASIGLRATIIAAVPAIVVGNALWIVLNASFVEIQYALPGFPASELGLNGNDRTDLAVTGVRSIRPLDGGMALLREARTPDGAVAFSSREIGHMQDVRGVISGFIAAWAAGVVALAFAALGLRRLGEVATLGRTVARGGALTLAIVVVVGVVALVNFDAFFAGFHAMFFEGDSWRFNDRDMLLQLYPELFWMIAATVIIGLIVVQAGIAACLYRRARPPVMPPDGTAAPGHGTARIDPSSHGAQG